MLRNNIDFKRGELVATSRALLSAYMRMLNANKGKGVTQPEMEIILAMFEDMQRELTRLIHNEFQFHGAAIGDPVQCALLILLMNGEEHMASGANK